MAHLGLCRAPLAGLLLLLAAACATRTHVLTEPIATDRPDFSEGVATVAKKHTQLETGLTFSNENDTSSWALGEVLIRYGIANRLEGRVAINSFVAEHDGPEHKSGFENMVLSSKVSLRDAGEGARRWQPAVSMLAGATVPTGSSDFRSAHVLPFAKLLTNWELSNRVEFASNLNWSASEDDGSIKSEWDVSGSLGVALTDRVETFAESFAIDTRNSDAWHHLGYVDGGVTFRLTPSAQVDARIGLGPFAAHEAFFAGFGFAYRW